MEHPRRGSLRGAVEEDAAAESGGHVPLGGVGDGGRAGADPCHRRRARGLRDEDVREGGVRGEGGGRVRAVLLRLFLLTAARGDERLRGRGAGGERGRGGHGGRAWCARGGGEGRTAAGESGSCAARAGGTEWVERGAERRGHGWCM